MTDILILVVLLGIAGFLVWEFAVRNRFRLVRRRYAVTLKGSDGEFAGMLLKSRWGTLTFIDCMTVPRAADQAPQAIIGRIHVQRNDIAYLQELPEETRRT